MGTTQAGVAAQAGQWIRPVEFGPFFDADRLYYVSRAEGDKIWYKNDPEARLSVTGPRPQDYVVIPGPPQPWHKPQPMFGYEGIKYASGPDCPEGQEGFYIVLVNEWGDWDDPVGPYDDFMTAKLLMDDDAPMWTPAGE